MDPGRWSERLLAFAFSVLVAVVVLRFAWSEVQPVLPLLVGGLVVYGCFRWQHHR